MRKADIFALLVAALAGPVVAHSTSLWISWFDAGKREIADTKRELLEVAGLSDLHHQIHARVGERVWESRVKPDFLMALTRAAGAGAGTVFPSQDQIVAWAKRHPAEARCLLEEAANRSSRK